MPNTKRYYMHTLDGRPAFFHEDGADSQIVFASLRDHWRDDYLKGRCLVDPCETEDFESDHVVNLAVDVAAQLDQGEPLEIAARL